MKVTGIATQGRYDLVRWVTSYWVKYGQNEVNWAIVRNWGSNQVSWSYINLYLLSERERAGRTSKSPEVMASRFS